ncbi:MAG: type II toxin-antitoxin system RelE/ParE family toxin [Terracidiphilus sp.]
MAWRIEFEAGAVKDLSKLDRPIAKRITTFLRTRVAALDDPRSFGAALKGSELGELWRYRVGDYRIICEIRDKELVILAVSIGHRREVYR